MRIIKAGKKRVGRYTSWFFTFDDGACLDGATAGARIGLGKLGLIKRYQLYGISELLTYSGRIPTELSEKHALKSQKPSRPKEKKKDGLYFNNGEKFPECGKFDSLISCPPAPKKDYNHNDVYDTEGVRLKRVVGLGAAKRDLDLCVERMIEKGILKEAGTLVNPGFGEHKNGLWQ